MKNFIIFLIFILSFQVYALGGATSGGGAFKGIDASKVMDKVFDSIETIGLNLYSSAQLEKLKKIRSELPKIIMTDSKLPTTVNGQVQNGDAYSTRTGSVSIVNIYGPTWATNDSIIEHEELLHHELMVLAGIEKTADYTYTKKFTKLRENFWKIKEPKKVFCSINVYEKGNYYGNPIPGKQLGSGSSVMPDIGAKGDWGILADISETQALIWRGVIDSIGYFRMEIAKAKQYKRTSNFLGEDCEKNLPKEFRIDFGSIEVLEPMKVYFDPYQLEKPVANTMTFGEHFVIVVNCNSF